MTAPRLFVDAPLQPGAMVALPREQAHYLMQVMRLGLSDEVRLFNGTDGEYLARILDMGKREATVGLERRTRRMPRPGRFGLAFAPIKKARMEWLAEKATELGAAWLQPVVMRRCVVREVKPERLRLQTIEAAEQSERVDLPELRPAMKLPGWLEGLPQHLAVLHADEGGAGISLREAVAALPRGAAVAALVGPEGGFAEEERAMLSGHKQVVAVGLGPRVLRADTAALAMLACLQSLSGEWDRRPRWGADEEEEEE